MFRALENTASEYTAPPKKRVAVVGSGCAGLGALWALNTSTDYEVHLFEADEVLGGHTNTVGWKHESKKINVDTGFIVYNMATYPNFIEFLATVGVSSIPTAMTFGVSRDFGKFEWAGTSLSSVFAQPLNLASPRMWRLLYDVVRFNVYALDLLQDSDESEEDPAGGAASHANGTAHQKKPAKRPRSQESIGSYCDRNGYSQAFRDDYLIPMTAAVWSTPPNQCTLDFPALTLVRFMYNHHLLSTFARRPDWMTIPGGSSQYIDAIMKDFPPERVHLRTPVVGLEDINGRVILNFEDETEELFDHVILACHGDQADAIVAPSGTEDERAILSHFRTTENVAYLHNDTSLMPRRRATWSAWNLLTSTTSSGAAATDPNLVSLTYNMNILQHIPTQLYSDVLVSLNPPYPPQHASVQGKWIYQHPLYNPAAIRAQKALPRIQNTRGISYAGAWTKFGFHEDGFSSGLAVAIEHLGATVPWKFVDATFARGRRPRLTWGDWVLRWAVWWVGWGVGVLEMFWYAVEPGWWVVLWVWRLLSRALEWVRGLKGAKSGAAAVQEVKGDEKEEDGDGGVNKDTGPKLDERHTPAESLEERKVDEPVEKKKANKKRRRPKKGGKEA